MTTNNKQTFLRKKLPAYIQMASGLSLMVGALGVGMPAFAQDDSAGSVEEIVVTGQRKSIQSAQGIKRDSATVVDSIVAEDIGKLPDRSVTDALQRVPGITVSRYDNMGDPEHFAGEGAGVAVRGLSQVRAELNGRDIFSANGGRSLSFEDVPAELMSGVDVIKSPSADMIEGGLGGTVNLRTRMPFDADGQVASVTVKANYGDLIKEANGEYSALYSNRWETGAGDFGFLIDISSSDLSSRADNIYNRAFFPRDDIETGQTVYVPRGADWRRNDFQRTRDGQYVAFQWAPNDETEVYLTAFRSHHKQRWDENAFFIDAGGGLNQFNPSKGADDWTYDENGALVSGTLTTTSVSVPEGNGVPFGTSTRYSLNDSVTTDYSAGVKWSPDDHWKFNADIQYVKSNSDAEDYTIGLVSYPSSIGLDNLDGIPSITVDSDLTDFTNFSWGQMMSMPAKNEADSLAFKVDAEYSLDDSIIKSVKVGARFTDKSAENRSANNWSARYQPWQVGGDGWQPFSATSQFPTIQNDDMLTLFSYGDFFRGDASVPTTAYMVNADLLKDFRAATDAIVASTPGGAGAPDWNALDLDNSGNINSQSEKTASIYMMTSFGFDDLATPIDGNVGVRVVQTDNTAHGNITYPTFTLPSQDPNVPGVQPFYQAASKMDSKNSYTNVLPSLNLRLHATDDLLFRFAASQAIWRPEFWRMKSNLNYSAGWKEDATQSGTNWSIDDIQFSLDSGGTNPYLEPMKANQYDLSAEWYFDEHGGMAHATFFQKDVKDFFRTSTTTADLNGWNDVKVTWTVNTGTADIKGFEIGFTKFFDSLPAPFDGLGIDTNYTYIDSSTKVDADIQPVDTDGSTYGDMPFEGLSKNSFNIIGMYEKDGWSARLAYNWRSQYLVAVGPNGWNGSNNGVDWKLPIYNDDYGQLDASIGYSFGDHYTVNLEASNLTKEVTKGIMKQNGAGDHAAYYYSQDVRYAISFRATF